MTEINTPNLNYAAALLKRLISPLADADPGVDDFRRLTSPLSEIAFAVLSEGHDKAARKNRLQAELKARDVAMLMATVESADPQADLQTLQTKSGWQGFDLFEVQDEIIPPTEYLVKPYITKPGVTIFFGRPKDLKSLLVLELSLHVANGLPWLTSSPSANDGIEVQRGKVFWLDQENGQLTMKRRLQAFQAAIGKRAEPGQFVVYSFPSPPLDLSKEENVNEMIFRLQSLGGIDLFVLDHLGTVFGDVEENSPQAGRVMGAIKRISEVCGISILVIHHANKFTKQGGTLADTLRGSGAILANIDSLIFVKRDEIDRNLVQLIPAAVRGPDIKNVNILFSYEQDSISLDLKEARFWKIAWRDGYSLAREIILNALKDGVELNHSNLRRVCREAKTSGVTDQVARDTIDTLTSAGEILMRPGKNRSQLYKLPGGTDEDE